jgi:hypothetical protein
MLTAFQSIMSSEMAHAADCPAANCCCGAASEAYCVLDSAASVIKDAKTPTASVLFGVSSRTPSHGFAGAQVFVLFRGEGAVERGQWRAVAQVNHLFEIELDLILTHSFLKY